MIDDIDDDDYDDDELGDDCGFLIDSDGQLITIFGPDEMFTSPSENMVKILQIFGISNPDEFYASQILH